MKTKKVNKFNKASSKLAFLFACAIVVSPGITSLQSCATTSEDIPCEFISSSNDNEIIVASFNKTMKQTNRKNNDNLDNITNYSLESYDILTKRLQMSINLYSSYFSTNDFTEYLYVNFNFYYDVPNNTITSSEIEVEYRNDYDDNAFLKYFTPSNNLLIALTNSTLANPYDNYIDIYCDSNINIEIYFVYNNSSYIESYLIDTEDEYGFVIPTFGTDFYGVYYRLGNLANELRVVRQVYNETYQLGYNVGNQEGYDSGYDNGYDYGYDEGILEGQESGFDRGYDEGLQDGYHDGYDIGRHEGYDEGYDIGYHNGDLNGYNNGFNDGKIASGTSYQDGYNKGYLDAKNQYQNVDALSFEDVLTAVITAPNKIIRDGFDFDILGINVGSFIQTCIVIGLIVFTIGLFKKG